MNGELARAEVRGEGIRVRYRNRTVVDVDAVSLPAGKTLALLGASGAGKSTLLRVLGLLERPSEGRVFFNGQPARPNDLRTRRTIAAVFQKPYLLRDTVGANVGYGLRLRRVSGPERRTRVADALRRVGLEGWEKRPALTLSGGEAQRVALARALVLQPSLLMLDEPLSYMDPLLQRQLSLEFADILSHEGITTLYVTHSRDEAAVIADRIAVMREGRIIAEDDSETLMAVSTDEWVAAFLSTHTALAGRVVEAANGLSTIDAGGVRILAASEAVVGSDVLFGVRPEDVWLLEPGAELDGPIDRNRIDAVVAEVVPHGATFRIVVESGGVRLSSLVSRSALKSLLLRPGAQVSAVFQPAAVHVRPRE